MTLRVLRRFSSLSVSTPNRRTRFDPKRKSHRIRVLNGSSFRSSPQSSGAHSIQRITENSETESYTSSSCERFPARRVLLKISGEALQGDQGFGLDPEIVRRIASEIRDSNREGIQIAIVVGGGNFFRGVSHKFDGIDRATADHVGMLATTMNAICLQSILEHLGVPTRLQTALEMKEVAEPYIRRRAIRHLEKGRVVIFGAGTGSPFFSTDMAAALRAAEINAHEILKATKVEGVYTHDPMLSPEAELLQFLTFDRALNDELKVMDQPAIALCKDQSIPVRVFSLYKSGNISHAIRGGNVGSLIRNAEEIIKNGNELSRELCQR
eukprot:g7334.t1